MALSSCHNLNQFSEPATAKEALKQQRFDQKGEKNLSPLFVIEIMDNSFRNKVFLFIILLCLVLILIIILLVSIIKRVAIRKAEDKKNNPPKLNIGKVKKKK